MNFFNKEHLLPISYNYYSKFWKHGYLGASSKLCSTLKNLKIKEKYVGKKFNKTVFLAYTVTFMAYQVGSLMSG